MRFENFMLKKNNLDRFEIAEFERKTYTAHLGRIKKAMKNGTMVDNVITVIPDGDRYKIIDGQHRFFAWASFLKDGIMKKIPLHLRVMDELQYIKNGRETYISLDSAKPLSGKDILKVYDDGKQNFFNLLRRFCTHYGSKKNLTFFIVLAGYRYMVTSNPILRKPHVEKTILQVTDEDIHKLAYVVANLYTVTERDTEHFLYRGIIFRNIIKLVFDNPVLIKKQKQFQAILKGFMHDSFLQQNQTYRSIEAYKTIYSYICEKANQIMKNKRLIK